MDRPAAVGRGRFKPLVIVIVIVIAALRHQFANASLGAGSLNVRRGPRGMQTRFSSADTESVGLSHGAKGVEVPARVKPSCRALMRRCLLTTRRKAVPLQDAAPDFLAALRKDRAGDVAQTLAPPDPANAKPSNTRGLCHTA